MFQPLATPSHPLPSAQWTITYPTLVAPRPLRPAHSHYHPYHLSGPAGRSGSTRHTRVPARLRVVPSPTEALARISLVDQPTPPPDVPDESQNTITTLSSETLEEFLRILQKSGDAVSPVQTESEAHPVISENVVTSASPTGPNQRDPLPTAPVAWGQGTTSADGPASPEPIVPLSAPVPAGPEWCRASRSSCVVRTRTRTCSQSPSRDHDRWSHPYRRETCPGSRTSSEKSNRHSRASEPALIRPSPRRTSKRASASWASSETDVSEPADLGSSQNEDADVELASNRGDVDDEELLARSADSSTCEDIPKTHSMRSRMTCTPASPISRRHTSNPLSHYSPMLFETLAARARANAFSPSHSRSPSPTPAPHVPDPLDEDEEDVDADEYQPVSVIRMEMPRSSPAAP